MQLIDIHGLGRMHHKHVVWLWARAEFEQITEQDQIVQLDDWVDVQLH